MMKRERVQMKDSCCPSIKPANAESIFAPRPFAPKVEEQEAPAAGPGIGFSLADISIFPRETVQPKIVLGPVGDRYEQEADRVERQVVETISSSDQGAVQRQDLEDEEELDLEELKEEEELRLKVDRLGPAGGADVGPDFESAIQRARPGGQPLSDGVRQPMERAFGADFGGVRVHADGEADRLNRSLQARAFTTGQDIFLRQGEFRPGSSEGQRLLAHELTHVVQQAQGRVKPTMHVMDWIPINDDQGLEYEADSMGSEVLANVARLQEAPMEQELFWSKFAQRCHHMRKFQLGPIQSGSTNRRHYFIDNSPRIVTQPKQIEEFFGTLAQFKRGMEEELQRKAATRVLQLKKNSKPEKVTDMNNISINVDLLIGNLKGKEDQEIIDIVWKHLEDTYRINLNKGRNYLIYLNQAIFDKARVIEANKRRLSDYNEKFIANYNSLVEDLGEEKYKVYTRGYSPKPEPKPEKLEDKDKITAQYQNTIDLSSGKIIAECNFGDLDPAREAGVGLNNSEILAQQYRLAVKVRYNDKEDEVSQAMKKLSKIMRDTIINDETKDTVYMAYPDGKEWNETMEWKPEQEEFLAILGTPNAKSSAFLLKDHLEELEKTIGKITTTENHGIDIDLIPIK